MDVFDKIMSVMSKQQSEKAQNRWELLWECDYDTFLFIYGNIIHIVPFVLLYIFDELTIFLKRKKYE